jgi:salicylate hydroxylase
MRVEGKGSLTPAASRTIVIAGAGIGGLTAALALAKARFRVIVVERAAQLEEAGAGIQLSPNASRILIELGVDKHLAPHAVVPDDVSVFSARNGNEIVRIPIGDAATFRYGTPYWIIRRADLQAALLATARQHPDIDLRLGHQLEDFAVHAKGVTIVQRKGIDRITEQTVALIGADGVWSTVRSRLFGDLQPRFCGHVAWRGVINTDQLPRDYRQSRVRLWLGPHAHLVAYPMQGGRQLNIVAIVTSRWNRPGWSEPGDPKEIGIRFAPPHWPSAARLLIGTVGEWRRYALFEVGDSPWAKGPVALLGDAAHAMLPFVAQGAAMAIEDASVLSHCLAESPTNIPEALRRYAAKRKPRVNRVRRAAESVGRIYHLRGLPGLARNTTMRLLGGKRLLSRQDWIYDWRAV